MSEKIGAYVCDNDDCRKCVDKANAEAIKNNWVVAYNLYENTKLYFCYKDCHEKYESKKRKD